MAMAMKQLPEVLCLQPIMMWDFPLACLDLGFPLFGNHHLEQAFKVASWPLLCRLQVINHHAEGKDQLLWEQCSAAVQVRWPQDSQSRGGCGAGAMAMAMAPVHASCSKC